MKMQVLSIALSDNVICEYLHFRVIYRYINNRIGYRISL